MTWILVAVVCHWKCWPILQVKFLFQILTLVLLQTLVDSYHIWLTLSFQNKVNSEEYRGTFCWHLLFNGKGNQMWAIAREHSLDWCDYSMYRLQIVCYQFSGCTFGSGIYYSYHEWISSPKKQVGENGSAVGTYRNANCLWKNMFTLQICCQSKSRHFDCIRFRELFCRIKVLFFLILLNTSIPLSFKYTARSASFFDLHLEIDSERQLRTKLYDKRDDFNFPIVNFPFISLVQ
jgi:magnesium-transporting ATPase (P-type)